MSNVEDVRGQLLEIQKQFPDFFREKSIFEFINIIWEEPVRIKEVSDIILDLNVKKAIERDFHVEW